MRDRHLRVRRDDPQAQDEGGAPVGDAESSLIGGRHSRVACAIRMQPHGLAVGPGNDRR